MWECMQNAMVAITAGGTTVTELGCMGVPIVCFSFVDNQEKIVKVFYERDYVEVDVTTLDKVIPENEKVTFIKMDIEGSEYAALQGAERLIKNCKPKLAISLYHCGEDYYRIPLYLKSIVPEYKFAVRHHKKNHVFYDMRL